MKALFAYDHRYSQRGRKTYSENHFSASFWDRFLQHFEKLTVIGRGYAFPDGKGPEDMLLSSRPEVEFELLPNISGVRDTLVNRSAVIRRMDELVDTHDAVIARLPSEFGLLALSAANRHATPAAMEIVGCPYDAYANYGSLLGKVYAPLAARRMAAAVRKSSHAIYVTERFLQERYPAPDAISESASNVELSRLDEKVLERRLARIRARDPRPLRLGLIGSLKTRAKGIQTVFAALARVRDRLPPLEFAILGGGDQVPWHTEAQGYKIDDIVVFEGSLPTGEPVLDWLDGIDIYLQPSFQEGLPRSLIEAMSRGCPAIGSNLAGIPELLSSEDLIAPGDSSALGSLLVERCRDREWQMERARLNWETARRYEKSRLDERRDRFWADFAATARN